MPLGEGIRFTAGILQTMNGTIDLTNDTINVMLTTTSYTPNRDTHADTTDVTNEVSDASYTAGGNSLAGKSFVQDDTNNRVYMDATDLVFSALDNVTPKWAIAYDATTTPNYLIGYWDLDDTAANGEDYTLEWAATGVMMRTAETP